MSGNIILLYNKNKNNFEDMLKNNLVNPKILMEQNNLGETVLHHLIKSNDNKCVENVLNFVKNNLSRTEKQKFIDTQDENGNTAFHLATQKRAFDIATLLDIYGANKKIPNNNNEIIDVDTEFTDSSDQINCGDRQKINKLVHNIIKPNKNYNNFSEELNSVQQNNKKMLSEKEEEWPKTLDEVNETDNKNNTDNSLSIELENLILSENSNKKTKTKKENNLTESPKSTELPESFDDIILTDSSKSKSDSNKKKNFINNFFDNFFGSKQKGGNASDKYTSDFNSSSTMNLNENMSEFETSTSEFLKYIDNKINQQGGRRNKASSKSKGKTKSKSRNIKSLSSSKSSKSSVSSFSSKSSDLSSLGSLSSYSSDLSSLGSNSSVSDLDMISLSSFGFSNLKGGGKRKKTKKSKYSISREFSKSDEIHKEVIKMIQDLGYSEQEARIIKAGLYTYTKDKHPELTNYERAVKMKSYATQQHIANLDINAIKQAIETHFANKKKETDKKMS